MAKVYHAPEDTGPEWNKCIRDPENPIFLAGSINMGAASDWQKQIIEALSDCNVTIYNPRRHDWDPTWEQSIYNGNFVEQVQWELDHLDKADYLVFVFDKDGPSPITLMELGRHAHESPDYKDIFVCCPEGFWRKGNVDILCARHGIPVYETVEELIGALRYELGYD